MKKLNKLFAISFMLISVMLFIQKSSFALIYPIGDTLTGLKEVPSNASPGIGTLTGTYNDVTKTISFTLNFSGLLGTTSAAHFHAPAGLSQNAPVVIGFVGFPTGVTSGSFSDSYVLTAQQEAWLLSDSMYVNVHSNIFPGGEIRSQVQLSVSQLNITVIQEGFYNTVLNKLNMRDTIKAYLRDLTTPYTKIDSAAAVIDSLTFTGNFIFTSGPNGNYYLVVKHRNSIETWSSSGASIIADSVTSYNFTDSASKAFGNNMKLKGGKYCIYSGDVDQDGIVDGSDASIVDNDTYNFVVGYVSSDVNGDRVVDASDASIVDNNSFNYVSLIRP